eukprot:3443947-Rhodomonas_salina.1
MRPRLEPSYSAPRTTSGPASAVGRQQQCACSRLEREGSHASLSGDVGTVLACIRMCDHRLKSATFVATECVATVGSCVEKARTQRERLTRRRVQVIDPREEVKALVTIREQLAKVQP